jgi:hypothetical protein
MFGPANWPGRLQSVDSDFPLDVRFVPHRSAGAFSCRWLNGAACWSKLSALARVEQASGRA